MCARNGYFRQICLDPHGPVGELFLLYARFELLSLHKSLNYIVTYVGTSNLNYTVTYVGTSNFEITYVYECVKSLIVEHILRSNFKKSCFVCNWHKLHTLYAIGRT